MDFTPARSVRVTFYPFLFLLLLIINCAEIAPPPGGEVDKTSPFIVASSPADGATDIPFNNQIIISLSERIVKPDQQAKAIYITPRPKTKPNIKWKSNQIIITLFDSVKTDQTYIVSLGTTIKDLRNNPIDSAGVIAFSTGPVINTGEMRGVVYDDDKPAANLLVGLYDPAVFINNRLNDSTYPDYVAQTNKEGFFSFKYLPDKKFNLIAFEDKNRNELLEMDEERFAVSDREIVINDEATFLDNLNCYLTSQDTLPPKIVSAGMTADKLVRISLNREIVPKDYRDQTNLISLTSLSDGKTYSSNFFAQANDPLTASMQFYIPGLPVDSFKVELNLDSLPVTFEKIVNKDIDDTHLPEIVEVTPDNKPVFESEFDLSIRFSEPLDTTKLTEESIVILSKDSLKVEYQKNFVDPFLLELIPASLEKGVYYRMLLTQFELVDLSGNAVGDSLSSYQFSLLNPDSLGSISGRMNNLMERKKGLPYQLDFTKLENRKIYIYRFDGGNFKAALPPGKYLISGFIDENNNNQFDGGSLVPYHLAETYFRHKDTISVRSRFDTGDITLLIK